jgi:hypothetical protein
MSIASGEITSVPVAKQFATAMLAHNKEIAGEIEHARASLVSRGVHGPVIDEITRLREHYTRSQALWNELFRQISIHEALAEQVRNLKGAAHDMSFYTNA